MRLPRPSLWLGLRPGARRQEPPPPPPTVYETATYDFFSLAPAGMVVWAVEHEAV